MVVGLMFVARSGGTIPSASAGALDSRVFGVNMGLFDSNEQLLSNSGTQQIVAGWHVPVIRVPTRNTLSDATELLALQTVKAMGATPLISVHGAVDSTVLADDTHLLGLVAQVFGSATAYVEYGNEEDLAGIDDVTYTGSWNAVVPSLKAAHPTYQFIGPVNFQRNPTYIGYFVGHAVPAPDIVSWHEYVCGPSDATSICLTHIANWSVHVTDTNNAEIAATGHTFPFMITEWNMDPQNDPRYLDPNVIGPFTSQALQELNSLVPSGLVGAQQYCVDSHGGGFELIDSNNALTPQGLAFQAALGGTTAPTPSPTPPPSPSQNPSPSPSPQSSPTPSPSAGLSATASASPGAVDAPGSVSFTGTAAGGESPFTYSWTFGDGASSSVQNPNHSYPSVGSYTATLKVEDGKGHSAKSTTHVTVYPALTVTPSVTLAAGHAPLAVSFTASVQGGLGPYTFVWAYGDGSTSSSPSATHTYGVGTFNVALTVKDAAGGAWSGHAATVSSAQSASGPVVSIKPAPRHPAAFAGAADRKPPSRGLAAAARALMGAGSVALVGSVLWTGLAIFAVAGMRRLG